MGRNFIYRIDRSRPRRLSEHPEILRAPREQNQITDTEFAQHAASAGAERVSPLLIRVQRQDKLTAPAITDRRSIGG